MGDASSNWFDQGGAAYARFRPTYPPELAAFLAASATARRLAHDIGCGTGQFTALLAAHFERVVGSDPSADQIANAAPIDRVAFLCASASSIPAEDASVDLITAAQAAHWFDLPAFYAEVRRVASPGARIALITYGVPRLPEHLDGRFQRFYHEEIGPFWPPERALVDRGYADLPFPFEELAAPPFEIRVAWPLAAWLGYVGTWSAVRRAREAGQDARLEAFAAESAASWGAPETPQPIRWPVHVRLGRLSI